MDQRTLVIVMGMHRSGSSLITRSLLTMGINLGDNLLEAIEGSNEKGHFEDRDILRLNIEMLQKLDTDWDSLRCITEADVQHLIANGFFDLATQLLERKLDTYNVFAFKDPRTTKLGAFWRQVAEALNCKTHYLVTARHPASIVESLVKRDRMTKRKANYLYISYLITILKELQEKEFIVIDYDEILENPEMQLHKISENWGRKLDQISYGELANDFIDLSMRHHANPDNTACTDLAIEIHHTLITSRSTSNKIDAEKTSRWLDSNKIAISEIMSLFENFDTLETNTRATKELLDLSIANLSQENARITHEYKLLQRSSEKISEENVEIANKLQLLKEVSDQKTEDINQLRAAVSDRNSLAESLQQCETMLNTIRMSLSWQLTKPLRLAGRLLRNEHASRSQAKAFVRISAHRIKAIFRYLSNGDIKGLSERIKATTREKRIRKLEAKSVIGDRRGRWCILTPGHTLFLAETLAKRLEHHGWEVDITNQAPKGFSHDMYIVLCAQIFDSLPPGEKRIIYQLEQSVSSRWFTKEYLRIMEESRAVIEYAFSNLDFLAKNGIAYPHVNYVPIGIFSKTKNSATTEKNIEVLFYGDRLSSPRRRIILEELQKHVNVTFLSETFGDAAHEAIRRAKCVINIHYYENALLEMPRIQECLSLGTPVVSESSSDCSQYKHLGSTVRFFPEGDTESMIVAVREILESPPSSYEIECAVEEGEKLFRFHFDRFLISTSLLPAQHARSLALPLPTTNTPIVLSMPETIERRLILEANQLPGSAIFDGIRRKPGWIGCGLSYLALTQHALNHDWETLTVMEDDVILPEDASKKLKKIREFLDTKKGKWDVFAGVIAVLDPASEVSDVESIDGMVFVTINKMTSTVFNIYSKHFMQVLQSWNPENTDASSNTIDKFIESRTDLKVIVTLPFLVGHREEVHSSLWGFQNTQYRDLIAASEALLAKKVAQYHQSSRT